LAILISVSCITNIISVKKNGNNTMSKFKELIHASETVGLEGEVEKVTIRRFI
jgi:hypothetical protein